MMNLALKRSTAIIVMASLVAGMFIPLLGLILPASPVQAAAWWNEDYKYRKIINIDHATSEDNVYWQTTIDTSDSDKFKGDCSDLRFISPSGQNIPYHIISGCGTASTVVQLLFATLPTGNQDISMYYGNPSALAVNVAEPFNNPATGVTLNSTSAETMSAGPAAHWKFNEGYGPTTKSSTTTTHDAALTNPAWQSDESCPSSKCLAFDGTNYGQVADADIFSPSVNHMAISFWAKIPANAAASGNNICGSTGRYMLAKGATGGGGWEWGIENDNNTRLCINLWQSNGVIYSGIGLVRNLNDSLWHHYAVMLDPGNRLILYIDGRKAHEVTSFIGSMANTTNPIDMGRRSDGNAFIGSLDDIKLYNNIRTQQQVQQDYTAGMQQLAAQQASLSNGLVGYWKMDEASWNGTTGEVKDASGNNNHGVSTNGATTSSVSKFGNGGSFDGVNDEVSLGVPSGISSSRTLAIWARPQAAQPDSNRVGLFGELVATRIDYGNGVGSSSFHATTIFSSGSPNYVEQSAICSGVGAWSYLVYVIDDVSRTSKLYCNGALGSSTTWQNGVAVNPATNQYLGTFTTANHFNGNMDEVRIYNRALSANEIAQLYNYAPKPVGYWDFEEGSGSTVYDKSGNNYHTTWQGTGQRYDNGKIGRTGSFNGQDDAAVAINTSPLTTSPSGGFSISAWIHLSSYPAANSFVVQLSEGIDMSGGTSYLGYMIASNGTVRFRARATSWGPTITAASTTPLTLNTWNHVAISATNAGQMSIYINGLYNTSSVEYLPVLSALDTVALGAEYTIGGDYPASAEQLLGGRLDEVRMYNYARTPQQILQDMQASQPGAKQPVGHWKFDEGQGSAFKNSGLVGSPIDGTLDSAATWSGEGKQGSALKTNGTSAGDALIPDHDSIDFASNQDFAISFWMRDGGSAATNQAIIEKWAGDPGYSYVFRMNASNSVTFARYDGTANPGASGTVSIVDNNYHHIVGTKNGARLNLYIDGKLTASGNDTTSGGTANNSAIYLGSRGSFAQYWNGYLDEIKIYNAALTTQEIAVDYNLLAGQKVGAISTEPTIAQSGNPASKPINSAGSQYCVPGSSDPCAKPVAEYTFEEGSGATIKDSSGNGRNATWNGSTANRYVSGKSGKGGSFNGLDDYANAGVDSTFDGTSGLSVSAWLYPTSSSEGYWIGQGGISSGWAISRNAAGGVTLLSKQLDNNNAVVVSSTTTIPLNTWTYVTVNLNIDTSVLSNNTANIFFNGIRQPANTSQSALPAFAAAPFRVGARGNVGTTATFFQGQIDQIRIYNYLRTPAQVAWDYNYGKPLAHYKMDECQGNKINDSSGNNLFGTLNLGVSGTTTIGTCHIAGSAWGNGALGRFNSSINFDGIDDSVISSQNMTPGSGLTMATWIYPDVSMISPVGYPGIVRYASPGLFIQQSTGRPYIQVPVDAGGPRACVASQSLVANTWQHIAGVYSFSDTQLMMQLYINGRQVCNIITVDTIGTPGSGKIYLNYGGYNGRIDDVQFFNYALTAEQIKVLYNNGAVRWGP